MSQRAAPPLKLPLHHSFSTVCITLGATKEPALVAVIISVMCDVLSGITK